MRRSNADRGKIRIQQIGKNLTLPVYVALIGGQILDVRPERRQVKRGLPNAPHTSS